MLKKIGLVLLSLCFLAAVGGGVYLFKFHYRNHKAPAEANAQQYAKDMGFEYTGVSCTNSDTDGDRYVSCSLRLSNGTVQPLQCVGAVPFWHITKNEGCKIPKFQQSVPSG